MRSPRSDLAARPHLTDDELSRLVGSIKILAMDAVERAKSGHPGMPMGAATMAAVLWSRHLVADPRDPRWFDRDRFVLSAGHGSMLLYALLHLFGYDVSREDLQAFRQWGSRTPGHPEFGHTPGVEVTTGPLGTGFGAGVGLALAERMLAARFNRPGHTIIDHFTYGIVSDGDLMEGVAAEAASFAGHHRLGKLVYLWDDNQISIDGGTELCISEDVAARFTAYGWHVQRVDGHDAAAIEAALSAARDCTDRPSLIAARTIIGHGAPTKQGTSATHGAPLGKDEIARARAALGWSDEPFYVPPEVPAAVARVTAWAQTQRASHADAMGAYARAHPELARELERVLGGALPEDLHEAIPTFADGESWATRKASQRVLQALSDRLPEIVGGSADLAGSNGVALEGVPACTPTTPEGRVLHFGVREHGMAAISNGLALHGGLRPYGATFLVFSDFMRGGLRLASLMGLAVVHVLSHDSFWVGEDGPTHQPIEHTMSLRLIPGLFVVRPADARETAGAWRLALSRKDGPTVLLLTRQNLPVLAGSRDDLSEGAYVLVQEQGRLDGVIVATGSEVAHAVAVARALAPEGLMLRVVSMPCWEAFSALDESGRSAVIPARSGVPIISIEAGATLGWERWATHHIGIDHFGASAPGERLAEAYGFTDAALTARCRAILRPKGA